MKTYQLKANESFLQGISQISNSWFWLERRHFYIIENGCFLATDEDSYKDLLSITSKSFHKNIIKSY